MASWLRSACNLICIAVPVISLFGSAPTFFLLWFLLRLTTSIFFPDHVYRRCDDYLYSLYQKFVLFFFETWVRTKIYFHGDFKEIVKQKENVLFISNHQSSVDWVIANMLAVRQGSLGHVRYVLKNDLKWIPLYGFYFQQHGCIYVRRNDKGDLERVEKGISQIKSNGLPVWLVIFPEGTRYNPIKNMDVIERSRSFAQQKGQMFFVVKFKIYLDAHCWSNCAVFLCLISQGNREASEIHLRVPPFDNVLYPRTGATVAAINALKDKFDAVYDVTTIYSETYDEKQRIRLAASSMTEYLHSQTKELHIHIKRIPMDSVPSKSNEQIADWLYERFVTKDKLLKNFYSKNRNIKNIFGENDEGVRAQIRLSDALFSCIFFLLTTLLLLLTPQGRTIYWQICLFATPICLLWVHLFPVKNIN